MTVFRNDDINNAETQQKRADFMRGNELIRPDVHVFLFLADLKFVFSSILITLRPHKRCGQTRVTDAAFTHT